MEPTLPDGVAVQPPLVEAEAAPTPEASSGESKERGDRGRPLPLGLVALLALAFVVAVLFWALGGSQGLGPGASMSSASDVRREGPWQPGESRPERRCFDAVRDLGAAPGGVAVRESNRQ